MEGDKAARKLIKSIGREVVHIIVGKELQDFSVHKTLICHHSPYFTAAFTSGFEETTTGIMKLEDVEVAVFELFYHWLYTQQITEPQETITESKMENEPRQPRRTHIRNLVALYVFGDMIQARAIQNDCIKIYSEMSISEKECLVEYGNIGYFWEYTFENDPIRQFIFDIIIWLLPTSSLMERKERFHFTGEIQVELIMAMRKIIEDARNESDFFQKGKRRPKTLTTLISPSGDPSNYYHAVGAGEPGDEGARDLEERAKTEEILDSKWENGYLVYRAKFVGLELDDIYYLPEAFKDVPELIAAFHKRYPRRPRPERR